MVLDRYQQLGLSFIFFGAVFASYSYIVFLSVPLTALGLACIIVGSTLLLVPSSPVPMHQIRAIMESSLSNIEALLEEFDAWGKAVYVPPIDGRFQVFVPVSESMDLSTMNTHLVIGRVMTVAGGIRGVMIFPPGSEAVRLSLLPEKMGAENALIHVLVDFVEAVESVKMVEREGDVVVELVSPRLSYRYPRVNHCIGSYPVSLVGCVLAYVFRRPIQYRGEEVYGNSVLAYFSVISSG